MVTSQFSSQKLPPGPPLLFYTRDQTSKVERCSIIGGTGVGSFARPGRASTFIFLLVGCSCWACWVCWARWACWSPMHLTGAAGQGKQGAIGEWERARCRGRSVVYGRCHLNATARDQDITNLTGHHYLYVHVPNTKYKATGGQKADHRHNSRQDQYSLLPSTVPPCRHDSYQRALGNI